MQPYFDNASTSFPKPQCVIDAMVSYQNSCGASPGRGAYAQAADATDVLDRCRSMLCELVHAQDSAHCILTLNCTDALNLAINGMASFHRHLGEQIHVVTTVMDHNSVLRPIHALRSDGVTHTIVPANSETGIVQPSDIARAITPHTRLVAVAHGSNVTGTVQDLAAIGDVCHDIPLLVDAAQTMGHTPIDVQSMHIDLLAFPGHKGLLGPLGTGGLIMQPHMVEVLEPHRFGGTGSVSEQLAQPSTVPDKYESGSHNMVGICGLAASLGWILSTGVDTLHQHEISLCEQFIDALGSVSGVRIVGPQTAEQRCGVFSIVFDDCPQSAARQLEEVSGIQCRWGLHCAPLAHNTMGTDKFGGTVRISFGPFHTAQDIRFLIRAITKCKQLVPA